MSETWALRMRAADAAACGRVRTIAGMEVCQKDDEIWLRGRNDNDAADDLDRILRTLPAVRYTVSDDGQLTQVGRRAPLGYLPDGAWQPLREWLQVRIPTAALAAQVDQKISVTLVRSDRPRDVNVVLTTQSAWTRYALSAPQVRLDRWAFAASAEGAVVVRGAPPPPLDAIPYCESEGVAVQAGWHWSPPVDAAVMRELLEIAPGDLALLGGDAALHRIRGDQFVRATRSAVRSSVREAGADG